MANERKKVDLTKLKPSELIRVALADLAATLRDGRFRIRMADWVYPDNGKCNVCLAGAVMVQRCGVRTDIQGSQFSAGFELSDVFEAIDSLRRGNVHEAFAELGLARGDHRFNRVITPFHQSHIWFFADMGKLASDLESAGL